MSTSVLRSVVINNRISAEDVLKLRQLWYGDGQISREEAEYMIHLNTACTDTCPEWADFFVEALCDYVVHQVEPRDYISVGNADWLIAQISADGQVNSLTELELLVKTIEVARAAPDHYVRFALEQVKQAVLHGTGPLCTGGTLEAGCVNAAEVKLLQRIIYGAASENNIGVSRAEAEVLFDIHDATANAKNDRFWADLFVKAVLNHLMAALGRDVPGREEAIRLEKWAASPSEGIGSFIGKVATGWGKKSADDLYADQEKRREVSTILAQPVTAQEAHWLTARIGRDGQLSDAEKAILAVIKSECPEVHTALTPLLKAV